MHYQFSEQSNIAPSATLAMNSLASDMRGRGVDVYNVSVGEAYIATHPNIIEAAKVAIDADKTNYAPGSGIHELVLAWTQWMNTEYGVSFLPTETTITAGGKHALLLLLQTVINTGDEVLFAAPYWVSYPSMVHVAGGVSCVLEVAEATGWKLTPEQLEAHITDRSRVLILNSAANPTGVVYTREELAALLMVAATHNLIVISDEVYSTLVYDGGEYVSCASFPEYRDRVCIVQSVSKHFAMTGWRVGAVFAPEQITKRVRTLQGQSTSGASSISQYAALGAFSVASEITEQVRTELQHRRDTLVACFAEQGVDMLPAASGLYQFVSIEQLGGNTRDSANWCKQTLEDKHVACVPGVAFGAEGYVRISFGGVVSDIRAAIGQLYIG